MEVKVFAQGQSGRKIIGEEAIPACPMACDDGFSMGVGLAYENGNGRFWGLVAPKYVIASYRGMKIAELVEKFESGTLAACWYAGNKEVHTSNKHYVDEIVAKIGKSARKKILETVPEKFDDMLTSLQKRKISFDGCEIEEEVKAGTLEATPKVRAYLDGLNKERETNGQNIRQSNKKNNKLFWK